MLRDEAYITVKAGNGGPGRSSFFPGGLRTGPDGGNGGRGGSVYAVLDPQMSSLNRYGEKKLWKAEHGGPGEAFRRTGADAEDLELPVPPGTSLIDQETREVIDITRERPRVMICRGGRGGRGNSTFKSSTNTAPRFAELGGKGQERHFQLVMKLIADYGLIGLPNAGKSSLLNELTAANAKVANYSFTTLEPNLGSLEGRIIADIPGLIEGASKGRGLGIKFLKHIEKVHLLVHCIAADSEDVAGVYRTVRAELGNYNPEMLDKPEYIILTKHDLVDSSEVERKKKLLEPLNPRILVVSIHDYDSLESLKKTLVGALS